jgi:REP element-mobilizing transposase RayT
LRHGKKGTHPHTGAVYHVILRGNDHRDIFADDKDRFRLFSILDLATQRFRFKIHAFCIMTTPFHLELQVADIPLSKIVQSIGNSGGTLVSSLSSVVSLTSKPE